MSDHRILCVVGGREYTLSEAGKDFIRTHISSHGITTIISGGAIGIDTDAMHLADEMKIDREIFSPRWGDFDTPNCLIKRDVRGFEYNDYAWKDTNIEMADIADEVIVFPGNEGTNHMFEVAFAKGLSLWDVRDNLLLVEKR